MIQFYIFVARKINFTTVKRLKTYNMVTLEGNKILLRALEPEDVDFLYNLENEESIWKVSSTLAPFSKDLLRNYIENSHRDIYDIKQFRFVICEKDSGERLGLIDLFDFNPKHRRVSVGITIYPKEHRQRGYAFDALKQICNYAFQILDVHQIYAEISSENESSIRLFEKVGFQKTGTRKAWIFQNGQFLDQHTFQFIRH